MYVLVCTAFIALFQSWNSLAFLYLGTYISWLYLRFFQHQPETSLRGDPSDEFKFSSFFPSIIEGPVDAVAGILAVIFRLKHAHAEGKTLLPTTTAMLSSNSVDANRRR